MKYFTAEQAVILLALTGSSAATHSRGGTARGGDSVAKAGNRIATSYRISNLSTGPESKFNFGVNADQPEGKAISRDTPLTARDVVDYLLELEVRSEEDDYLVTREADRISIAQFGGNARSGRGIPNTNNGRAGGNAAEAVLQRRFMDGGRGGDAHGGDSKARAGNKAYHSTRVNGLTANGNNNNFDFSSSSKQEGGNARSGPGGANYGKAGDGGKGGDLSLSLKLPVPGMRRRDISDDDFLSYLYARHLEMELESLAARDLEDEELFF